MLTSGLCDYDCPVLEYLNSGRADSMLAQLSAAGPSADDKQSLESAARGFASLFYSVLVQQMQKTVQSEENESTVSQGVQGFFGMFMPQVVGGHAGDPLALYILDQLTKRYGEVVDEQV